MFGNDRFLGFATGGIVPGPIGQAVPAIVHGGETIIPAGGSGGGSVNVHVTVNGTVVSTAFEAEVSRAVRNGLRKGGYDGLLAAG